MSKNCISCVVNKRTGADLLCDECRKAERIKKAGGMVIAGETPITDAAAFRKGAMAPAGSSRDLVVAREVCAKLECELAYTDQMFCAMKQTAQDLSEQLAQHKTAYLEEAKKGDATRSELAALKKTAEELQMRLLARTDELAVLLNQQEQCTVEWEATLGALNDENEKLKTQLQEMAVKLGSYTLPPHIEAEIESRKRQIAQLFESRSEMRVGLAKAIQTIRLWHGELGWLEYQHSPEMKQIKKAFWNSDSQTPATDAVKRLEKFLNEPDTHESDPHF